ncbi:hypothetical protein T4E_3046 [Trichinella pseudospiralis]|uniref:Uncharacterized protein n=1 Tax=Trichinella pseudospiralis TaxID=6337 RepID=A0A0V0Y394_TRIPS|nr:hypothetical protein T4E_3046 [Trichinella pseudospiralis]
MLNISPVGDAWLLIRIMENRENGNVHMEKRNEYWLAVSDSCWLWRMKCDENVKPTGGTLLPIRELNCSSVFLAD